MRHALGRWRAQSGLLALALGVGSATVRVAAAQPPLDVAPLIQTAQHDFDLGNYLVAIKTLQAATSQNSLSAEAFFWLGRSYYELRDFDNAVVHAEKAVALDAQKFSVSPMARSRLWRQSRPRQKFFSREKGQEGTEEAVRLNPSNIEARIDLEDFCMSAPWIVGGNKDEAREQVDAIAALDAVEGHRGARKIRTGSDEETGCGGERIPAGLEREGQPD